MSEWILSSSILILIVIGLRTLFKGKISLRLQYAIWGLVLLRLLLPVNFGSSSISVENLSETIQKQPAVQVLSDVGNLNIPSQSYEDAYHQVVQEYEAAGINVGSLQGSELEALEYEAYDQMRGKSLSEIAGEIALVIWFAGMVLVGIAFVSTNIRFRNRILSSRHALEIKKNHLNVYATGEIDTPCLFGIQNPAIYVTCGVADNQTLLRHTLEHEATHHRHGDHIWAVLRCVCLAVHWYNPLVWWAAFLSQRDAELACDEATIKRLGEAERAEYGRTLIGMTCQKKANILVTATTMNSGKSGLRERIILIAKKPKMALYTLLIVMLVAAIAVGCTFTGAKNETSGELVGTKVFPSDAEVTGMAIHCLPDSHKRVEASQLAEMAQWVLGFEYGEALEENTVLEPGSNTFSVTLYYADGTEQTACFDYETVDGITYRINRQSAPDCWQDILGKEVPPATEPPATEPPATEIPDNAPPVNIPELFSSELDKDRVCIAVQPNGLVSDGGNYLYLIPENQEALLKCYTAAIASAHTYTQWDSGNLRSGWWIVYQDMWWQVTESGAIFGNDPDTRDRVCIDANDARELYEFCDTEVKAAGIGEPVRPADITEIKSATLYWNGTHTVTDAYALNQIQQWIADSAEVVSASCWFTAQLTLELENGETRTISMATDDCAAWMSEGVVYNFGEITEEGVKGNEEFYSLFAPAVIHEKSKGGMDALGGYMIYLNWSRYANAYGPDEVFALIDLIEKWAAEEPTYYRFGGAIGWTVGLDGAYADYYAGMLARLYELAPSEFAWACLDNASDENEKHTLAMLSYHWNMPVEDVRAKLAADIGQN